MHKFLLFGLAVVASGSTLAQTAKQKIATCVESELSRVRTTEPFAVEDGVTCRAGIIKNFNCDKENKDHTVSYNVRDGYVITTATRDITSKTDRGSAGDLSWNERTASVAVSCRGNGCDRGEREWSKVQISGTVQRIPTEADRKSAMDKCLDEVLQ